MPQTRTSWEKGKSGNPHGRPRNSEIEELRKAIKKVQRTKNKTVLEHFVERSYQEDRVLIALVKKLVPDMKFIETKVDYEIIQTWQDLEDEIHKELEFEEKNAPDKIKKCFSIKGGSL